MTAASRYRSRVTKGSAVFALMVAATLILASCGPSATPTPVRDAIDALPATATPTPAPTATPTPADDQGTQVGESRGARVGVIESIEGDALRVATQDGVIVATLSDDTTVRRFAPGSLEDLSVGQQVSLRGQRAEEGVAPTFVVVTPEGTRVFQDTVIGEQRATLVGTIESIEGVKIIVRTQQGPFVATINAEETAIHVPSPTSREDLSPGQLVTVIGTEGGADGIEALSILITPDLGALFRGRRAGGVEGRTREQAGPTPTETPVPAFDQQRKAGQNEGINFLVAEGSEATFTVGERLALLPLPSNAIMRTTALSGEVHLDGRPSIVEIDLHQLTSDQSRRDLYVRVSPNMFREHPTAVFTIKDVRPLPRSFVDGKEVTAQLDGLLSIRGVEVPLSFDIEARDDGDVIFVLGRTSFVWADFGMDTPATDVLLSVDDEVRVEVLLAVRPLLASPGP